MRIKNESLLSHGSGPYRAVALFWGNDRKFFRLSMGGYGNMPKRKGGSWSWKPRYMHYRRVAIHLFFLNLCISVGNRW